MYKGKTVNAIIQARMGSTRLPGKVLKDLAGKKVLDHVVDRVNKSELVDKIVVATSTKDKDDKIEEWGRNKGVIVFRGSEDNVLKRYYNCSQRYPSDIICRITADCPLISYKLVDQNIELLVDGNHDFVKMDDDEIPRGIYGSALTKETLNDVFKKANKRYHKEHVTYYIYENNGEEYNVAVLDSPQWLKKTYRLTLDTELDYKLLNKIFSKINYSNDYLSLKKVIIFLDRNFDIANINKEVQQKKVGKN